MKISLPLASLCALALTLASNANAQDEKGVVVSIRNTAADTGTFQTPVWVGFHNGQFDSYDTGTLANTLPIQGSNALQRLAEDGTTGPISNNFSQLVPNGAQGTMISNGPIPPLSPGSTTSRLFRVNPAEGQYFSYASMVIPSNDAFVANANPLSHKIFNDNGRFVGRPFTVPGSQVRDAGTEVNDELPANTAFFGQAAPNTGVAEALPIAVHDGFLPRNAGGILADPMFRRANFKQRGYRNLRIRFREININRPNTGSAMLTVGQEIPAPTVSGMPFGIGIMRTNASNDTLSYLILASGLSSRATMAHLHVGRRGETGPVVADLLANGNRIEFAGTLYIFGSLDASAVVGPLANTSAPFDNLLAEFATQGLYFNVHTRNNRAGEIRGQTRFGGG